MSPLPRARSAAGGPQAPSPELEQRLRRRLFVLGASTLVPAVAAAFTITMIFWALTGRPMVFVWAAIVHGIQLVRWYFVRVNARLYPAPKYRERQPAGAWRYVGPLACSGIAWGLAPWMLIPLGQPDTDLLAVLLVTVYGMMAGSVPAVAPSRAAALVWLGPLSLGLATRCAWLGGTAGWSLCAGSMLYLAVMLRFAAQQRGLLESGLRSQIEKEALSEQLMAQSRDLERLNTERSRFFASASHDLRQPVHALALFSEALRRDLQDHPARPMADRVVEATRSVSGLLNAMLDISKIDAGAVLPAFGPVAVDQVFLRLMQLYESRAAAADLSLRFHVTPVEIVTDGDLLLRILSNFVDNAFKYCERGGVLVSARPRAGRLRLAVWDTGRGIGADHVPMVFDEFFQVNNAHRDIAQGLGIGLAIVKRLAALLEGEVGLRSVPGRGSVFWIELPMAPSISVPAIAAEAALAAPTAGAATAAAAGGPPPNILLLDDEVQVCEAMRIWLAPYCGDIHIAQSVEQARAVVERARAPIDALLVDFRLAGPLNGIEATRLLRDVAGRELPTILITGDTDPQRVRAAYESGLVVLFKPVQPQQLVHTLMQLRAGAPAPEAENSSQKAL